MVTETFLKGGIEEFLKYGVTGLAAFLALLSFYLLVREIRRESLRGLALVNIVVFMVFSCVLALLTQVSPDTVNAWLQPDHASICGQEISQIGSLSERVKQLECVKVKGKVVLSQSPVRITAIRRWEMWPMVGDDELRQKFIRDAAPIYLMFQSEDSGELRRIDEENIKDGYYDIGEVRLRKGINPFELLLNGFSGFSQITSSALR